MFAFSLPLLGAGRPAWVQTPLFILAIALLIVRGVAAERDLPNILWITCEDTGQELGCYGDAYARTPHLDRLAEQGLRYRSVWSTAPVCAPARTAIITGLYPTSLGAEHMRSEVRMPAHMKLYPQFLRERGYYCSNNSKEDYNLTQPGKVWDESSKQAHWRRRAPGQPFFAIFNYEITHESRIRARPHTLRHDPAGAPLPAYHPDTPEVRHDWAQYYDNVTEMDARAAERLQELADAGLKEDTIVFFYGDHGSGMPRSKRFPFNSGLQVALLVYVPEKWKDLAPQAYRSGGVSEELVSFVDLAPTLLSLAGIPPPDWMQGRAFMGRYATPGPNFLFGFRGRMDERYDLIRSVRNGRYIYIRNYMPHLVYGQFIDYMFQTPTTRVWKELYDQGKLRPPQTFFWEPKPPEELYDLENDRSEVNNLAGSGAHQAVLEELRGALRAHLLRIRDAGFLTEAERQRRSARTTLYEWAHDPAGYPLERILAMAESASLLKAESIPLLRDRLQDSDSGVRYWAALGLLMRGSNAVSAAHSELERALRDESPSVRITAAQALGEFGNESDLAAVLQVLRELAPADTNGAYVSMLALNAIAALGPKAAPLHDMLRTMPTKDPNVPVRPNDYVHRLVKEITGIGSSR
jgi:arylsulfatase A-like enzyme